MDIVETRFGKNKFSGYQVDSEYQESDVIVSSWSNGIHEVVSKGTGSSGLRAPQFGALCSIRSHWTVSKSAATIVMPTGTGKSETMLATIVTEKIPKSLIIVPSNLLRSQIYEKAKSFGILYEIGMLSSEIIPPNVFLLGEGIKEKEKFEEIVMRSNVIITTMTLASRMSQQFISFLSDNIDVLFVDEAHHVSSKTWSSFKESFNNNRILQFTATPFREDGKKIDGNILYNFPLRLAQEQGYFKEIDFVPIEEFDERKVDLSIARKAIHVLGKDIGEGYQHILLVRANKVKRAEELFSEVYQKFYKRFNPVLITSKQTTREKQERMKLLQNYSSKIVVCVDMFGEGIDIPNLKIAAIHDKYKSMPITLQFIGRFARSKNGLGNAKLITNIADDNIAESLQDLYDKDADWNKLLPRKSNEYIDKEVSLQRLIDGFNSNELEDISLIQMKPKVSMVAYQIDDKVWDWKNWESVFDPDQCRCYVNEEEKILIIIEPREVNVRWTTQQNLNNLEWNFYLVYWNVKKKSAFLNASDLSKGFKLLKNIFLTEPTTINNEQVFKCLHGIKRLSLGTVGLNSGIDGPIRYKMFAGIDVAEGISESNKANSYKSNVFGHGYDGNGKVSIGCSYKGTIWSRWVESIDYWKSWCNQILDKLLDPTIDVKDIMEGVLVPEVIDQIPEKHPYRIDWPNDLEFETDRKITLSNITGEYDISNVDILLDEVQKSQGIIHFSVGNEYFKERFSFEIESKKTTFKSKGNVTTEIKIGNGTFVRLPDFFQNNSPTIWFVDGSSIQGNILVELKKEGLTEFPNSSIHYWDWESLGVDIKVESQRDQKTYDIRENSIQYNVIRELNGTGDYSIIFDDDGAGEIADIVAIAEQEKSIRIDFFHCKYSHRKKPGSRVGDLYEVCGQADKSVFWKQDPIGMIGRMIHRENLRIRENKPSRFEKGDITALKAIKNKLLIQPSELHIMIVQPGVNGAEITKEMHSILSTSHSYCLDTFSVPLKLICSK
ncbi:DEAD/DEAH box helicase [Virgibacillus proomii]|uniref:DEAD/DEAH box helicase n=1 Tax=Virgibacillus proomii TaxID=84407 RepID=UPI0009875FAA|nr:DEAD/DEAH box helicase family protein [Virgibacillus proomii]